MLTRFKIWYQDSGITTELQSGCVPTRTKKQQNKQQTSKQQTNKTKTMQIIR
jgi:hypothetical protein